MIEALYITDNSNGLVFQHLKSSISPSFRSLEQVIQARTTHVFNSKAIMRATSSSTNTKSSASETTLPSFEVNSEYFLTYDKLDSLVLYVLSSHKNHPNPMIASVFIERLSTVLTDYFSAPVTSNKVTTSTDTLALVLNEMLHGDVPYTTDPNQLKDSIPNKTLLSKILSTGSSLANAATNKSLNTLKGVTPGISSTREDHSLNNIPWRRSDVKYTNNEMYVDIVESINVILKPVKKTNGLESAQFDSGYYSTSRVNHSGVKLAPITGEIAGQVNFKSHLSGIPMLQLVLRGVDFGLPSFHQCINIDKWLGSPGTLSFIPADGDSVLMDYTIDIDPKSLDLLGLVDIDFQSGLGDNFNEFEVKVFVKTHHGVSKIEDLSIEIICENSNDTNDDDTRDHDDNDVEEEDSETPDDEVEQKPVITSVKTKRITHGDFRYLGNGKSEWQLNTVKTGTQFTLHASISTNGGDSDSISSSYNSKSSSTDDLIDIKEKKKPKTKVKPLYLKVNFTYKGAVPSGLKVDNLNILSAKGFGDAVKPYKGVKYITKAGYFVVRS